MKVLLAGMLAPPNLGDRFAGAFQAVFPEVARANDAALVPFLLEGVAGNPDLKLADGIHPTPEGQRIVADTVWKFLNPCCRTRVRAQRDRQRTIEAAFSYRNQMIRSPRI